MHLGYFISFRVGVTAKFILIVHPVSVNFCYRAIGRNTQRNIGKSLLRQWQQHHTHAAKCFPKNTSWVSEYLLLFIIIASKHQRQAFGVALELRKRGTLVGRAGVIFCGAGFRNCARAKKRMYF